jgi:methylase of polypeptide subunit release factors
MRNLHRVYLKSIGDVYLPARFADAADAPIKLFGPKELDQLNRIFNHLRRGGVAVTSGQWSKILDLQSYLERKKGEFPSRTVTTKTERRLPTYRKRANRWYERHYQSVLSRVMVIAHDDQFPYVEPPINIPYLLELLGELPGSSDGLPFLVPVSAIQKIQSGMEESYHISVLEGDIITHSNVLAPFSQDTIELFQEALQEAKRTTGLSEEIQVLDMGCGCGWLSLLAARVFADHHVEVLATDILPEAIATTKINVQRFADLDRLAVSPDVIRTTDSGDLFDPVGPRRFDIIIFNVPWVISRPRSRAEIAICDEDQNIVRRFLMDSPEHLKEGGRIILGYSDHSGAEALENLESLIRSAKFEIKSIFKRRVQSRRQKRKWETLLVYDLGRP